MRVGRSPRSGAAPRPRAVGAALVLLLGLAACSSPAVAPQAPGTLTPTPAPAATTTSPTAGATTGTTASPTASATTSASASTSATATATSHERRRPSWIFEFVFGTVPGPPCNLLTTLTVGRDDHRFELQRLSSLTLCFDRPLPGATVEIVGPSAATADPSPIARQTLVTWWLTSPHVTPLGDLGTHSFRVVAPSSAAGGAHPGLPTVTLAPVAPVRPAAPAIPPGIATAAPPGPVSPLPSSTAAGSVTAGTITVTRAETPRWLVLPDERTVLLAGLTPGTLVYPTVFGPPRPLDPPDAVGAVYADLPPVTVDGLGEASFAWHPDGDLPPGTYGLWLENGPPRCQSDDRACTFFTIEA